MLISERSALTEPRSDPFIINASDPGYLIRSEEYAELLGVEREHSWTVQAPQSAAAVQLTIETLRLDVTSWKNVGDNTSFSCTKVRTQSPLLCS